jgi:hypothetical protein
MPIGKNGDAAYSKRNLDASKKTVRDRVEG